MIGRSGDLKRHNPPIQSGKLPRPLLLGHRGASRYAPENTLQAFALALQHGCDGFEFDLRYTSDAQCVVCHNALYKRRRIDRRTFHELKLLSGEEVIRNYVGKAYLDIELKVPPGEATPMIRILARAERGSFVISSFLPEALERVHDRHPEMPLGLICENFRQLRRWPSLPIATVMLHRRLASRDVVEELREAGKQVFVWTVNRERQMKQFAELGVDGLISDDTYLLARTLRPHGK